jgi:hypothetical protein
LLPQLLLEEGGIRVDDIEDGSELVGGTELQDLGAAPSARITLVRRDIAHLPFLMVLLS